MEVVVISLNWGRKNSKDLEFFDFDKKNDGEKPSFVKKLDFKANTNEIKGYARFFK